MAPQSGAMTTAFCAVFLESRVQRGPGQMSGARITEGRFYRVIRCPEGILAVASPLFRLSQISVAVGL